jgi:hypothetical protein
VHQDTHGAGQHAEAQQGTEGDHHTHGPSGERERESRGHTQTHRRTQMHTRTYTHMTHTELVNTQKLNKAQKEIITHMGHQVREREQRPHTDA